MNISKKNNKGMTLMEILIVVMLIGILSGVLIRSLSGSLESGKRAAAQTFIEKTLAERAMAQRSLQDQWPTTIKDLGVSDQEADPWGRKGDAIGYGLKEADGNLQIWVNFTGKGGANPPDFDAAVCTLTPDGAITMLVREPAP